MPDLFCFTASLGGILSLAVSCILYVYGRLFCMFQSRCRAIGTGSKASQNSCKAQFSSTFQYDWLFFVHLYQYVIFSSWTKDPRFRLLRAKLQLTLAALSELHLDAFNIFRTWTWVMLVMFISDFTELQKTTCWSCWQRLGSDGSDGASGTAASAAAAASARACYRLRMTEDDSGSTLTCLDILHISSYFSISEELTRPAVLPLCWPKVPVSQNSSQTAEGLWLAYEGLWRLRRPASCATPGLFSTSLSSLSSLASCEEKCLCHVQNDPSDAAKCKSIRIPFCKVDEIGTFSSVRVILSAPVAPPVVLLPHAVTSLTQAELRPASWHLLRPLRLPRQNHRDLRPKSSKTFQNRYEHVLCCHIYIYIYYIYGFVWKYRIPTGRFV